jgi:hypothetical protein
MVIDIPEEARFLMNGMFLESDSILTVLWECAACKGKDKM